MPPHKEASDGPQDGTDSAAIFEEGRVYYVGATRARKMLATTGKSTARVGYLDSGRIYRLCGETRAQLEVGREGDVDKLAHLAWSNSLKSQHALAAHCARTVPVNSWTVAEDDYALRITLMPKEVDGITRPVDVGQFSASFLADLKRLWSRVDSENRLRPPGKVPHLYLAAVGTVGLTEHERTAVKQPYSQSALALAPVVKGFPMIQFVFRRKKRFSR
jgi:hypothetical protein